MSNDVTTNLAIRISADSQGVTAAFGEIATTIEKTKSSFDDLGASGSDFMSAMAAGMADSQGSFGQIAEDADKASQNFDGLAAAAADVGAGLAVVAAEAEKMPTFLGIEVDVKDDAAKEKLAKLGTTIDETKAKWGSMGDAAKSMAVDSSEALATIASKFTPLNVALALATSAVAAFGVSMALAHHALTSGGEFNEAKTGFDNLAKSAGVNGDEIIKKFREIGEGTVGAHESLGVLGKAIRANLGEEQIATISTFAKRYSELTGASFVGVAEDIVRAVQTGRTRSLKQYSLMVDDVSELMGALKKQTSMLGEGAFNFGDIEKGVGVQLSDLAESIGKKWNELMGKGAFGDTMKGLVDSLQSLADMGPAIGDALGAPVIGVLNDLGTSIQKVTAFLGDIGLTQTDFIDGLRYMSIGVMALIGGLEEFANAVIKTLITPLAVAAGAIAKVGEVTGALSEEQVTSVNRLVDGMQGLGFNTDKLGEAMIRVDKSLGTTGNSTEKLDGKGKALSGNLKQLGMTTDEAAKSAAKLEKSQDSLANKIEASTEKYAGYEDAIKSAQRTIEDIDNESARYSLKETARAERRVDEIESEGKSREIAGERRLIGEEKQDAAFKEQQVNAAKAVADALEKVNSQSLSDRAKDKGAADKEYVKALKEQAKIEQDIAFEMRDRKLQALADEQKAEDEQAKRDFEDAQRIEDDKKKKIEADQKRADKEAEIIKIRHKEQLLETKGFVDETNKLQEGILGADDEKGSKVGSATAAMISDAEKNRGASQRIVDSNNALAAILTALQKGGLKMLINVINGDSAIGQLVRRVIQESELQAELSGATVPGV